MNKPFGLARGMRSKSAEASTTTAATDEQMLAAKGLHNKAPGKFSRMLVRSRLKKNVSSDGADGRLKKPNGIKKQLSLGLRRTSTDTSAGLRKQKSTENAQDVAAARRFKLGESKAAREGKTQVLRPKVSTDALTRRLGENRAKREARNATAGKQQTILASPMKSRAPMGKGAKSLETRSVVDDLNADQQRAYDGSESSSSDRRLPCLLVGQPKAGEVYDESTGRVRRLSKTPGAISVEAVDYEEEEEIHVEGEFEEEEIVVEGEGNDYEEEIVVPGQHEEEIVVNGEAHLVTATLVEEDDDQEVQAMKNLVEEKDSRLAELERELAMLRQQAGKATAVVAEPVVEPPKPVYHYDKNLSQGENFAMEMLLGGAAPESRQSTSSSRGRESKTKRSWGLFG